MGKYYSTATDSNAFANSDCFALANLDIFTRADRFCDRIALCDLRISDLERDAGQVNTDAARAKCVLLMAGHRELEFQIRGRLRMRRLSWKTKGCGRILHD